MSGGHALRKNDNEGLQKSEIRMQNVARVICSLERNLVLHFFILKIGFSRLLALALDKAIQGLLQCRSSSG